MTNLRPCGSRPPEVAVHVVERGKLRTALLLDLRNVRRYTKKDWRKGRRSLLSGFIEGDRRIVRPGAAFPGEAPCHSGDLENLARRIKKPLREVERKLVEEGRAWCKAGVLADLALKGNPDVSQREAERAFRKSGSVRDEAAWVAQRIRSGEVPRYLVYALSCMGDPAAVLVAGSCQEEWVGRTEMFAANENVTEAAGRAYAVIVAMAMVEMLLPLTWPTGLPMSETGAVGMAVEYARAWLAGIGRGRFRSIEQQLQVVDAYAPAEQRFVQHAAYARRATVGLMRLVDHVDSGQEFEGELLWQIQSNILNSLSLASFVRIRRDGLSFYHPEGPKPPTGSYLGSPSDVVDLSPYGAGGGDAVVAASIAAVKPWVMAGGPPTWPVRSASRNPDKSLRQLEREAASGDPGAVEAYRNALRRIGVPVLADQLAAVEESVRFNEEHGHHRLLFPQVRSWRELFVTETPQSSRVEVSLPPELRGTSYREVKAWLNVRVQRELGLVPGGELGVRPGGDSFSWTARLPEPEGWAEPFPFVETIYPRRGPSRDVQESIMIGPGLGVHGVHEWHFLCARAQPDVYDAIRQHMLPAGVGDHIDFKVTIRGESEPRTALVTAANNVIIGSRWLAIIPALEVPGP